MGSVVRDGPAFFCQPVSSLDSVPARFKDSELLNVAYRSFTRDRDKDTGEIVVGGLRYVGFSITYAFTLLARGAVSEAEKALDQFLTSQDRDPNSPTYGLFEFAYGAPIEDLNAPLLLLHELITLVDRYGETLRPSLRSSLEESIVAGLEASVRTDVALGYSNSALLDASNRVLGGQLLADRRMSQGGRTKLMRLVAFANERGGLRDYMSPSYTSQMLNTAARLATDTTDEIVRSAIRLVEERLWLQAMAHYHPGLAQFAGPYSRAYADDHRGQNLMKAILYVYLDDERLLGSGSGLDRMAAFSAYSIATREFALPRYALELGTRKELPYEVIEEPSGEPRVTSASYLGEQFTLGTASRSFGSIARSCIAHSRSRAPDAPAKVLYSRFLVAGEARNRHLEDRSARERKWGHDDWGLFAGLQVGQRAIALYGIPLDFRRLGQIACEIFVHGLEPGDTITAAGTNVTDGGAFTCPGWLVLDLGHVYAGIYALEPTQLGAASGELRVTRDGDLARLAIVHYSGVEKFFWQYAPLPWVPNDANGPPYFRGNLRSGFVIEIVSSSEYDGANAFAAALEDAFVGDECNEGVRTVRYARAGRTLDLSVDLLRFEIVAERLDGEPRESDLLRTPDAYQLRGDAGVRQLAGTEIRADGNVWVVRGDRWVVVNPTDRATRVEVGGRDVEVPAFDRKELEQPLVGRAMPTVGSANAEKD